MSNSRSVASPSYQLFMLILCFFALAALTAQVAINLAPGTRRILELADYFVCLFFLFDFGASLLRAPDRRQYMLTWGWLDLLSSIPALDLARWGRAARIVRIFRVLRGLRATRLLAGLVVQRRAESGFLAATLVAILLVVICSIAVLQFETSPEANIKTADDAIWWALTTITTVGYGDRFPTTGEGRFVAVILMCAGVGLFGTFSAYLAAWFLQPEDANVESEISLLRAEVMALRQAIENRTGGR